MFPGQALALELDAALTNDPFLDELAFVQSATLTDLFGPNEHTHPPGAVTSRVTHGAFVLVEHKLAVSVAALVPLYNFASCALKRADEATRVEAENTANTFYGSGKPSAPKRKNTHEIGVDPVSGVDAARLLLLVNGDHATAWNRRKTRLLLQVGDAGNGNMESRDTSDTVDDTPSRPDDETAVDDRKSNKSSIDLKTKTQSELFFVECVLSRFPKAQHAWGHRRWVLSEFPAVHKSSQTRNRENLETFDSEVAVANAACLRKRLNYAAWRHRRWCALRFSNENSNSLQDELTRTAAFVQRNVSDYCGLHYRQSLLLRMMSGNAFKKQDDTKIEWNDEVSLIRTLISRYPGREALWCHARFLCFARLQFFAGEKKPGGVSLKEKKGGGTEKEEICKHELEYAASYLLPSTRIAGENESESTSFEPLHPSWAEHPAGEQVRFATAHALWVLELARRFRVPGFTGNSGAKQRTNAAIALEKAWPWGKRAADGMRRARIGGGKGDECG